VMPNNDMVGQLAAKYLIAQGHQRLVFLRVDSSHLGFHQREESFIAAAQREGFNASVLAPDPSITMAPHSGSTDFTIVNSAVNGITHLSDVKKAMEGSGKISGHPGAEPHGNATTGIFVPRGRL